MLHVNLLKWLNLIGSLSLELGNTSNIPTRDIVFIAKSPALFANKNK